MSSQIRRRRPVLLASQLCFELLAVVKADSAAPNKRKEVITKEEEEEIPRAARVPYLTAVVVTGPNISFLPSREKSTRPITQAN